VITTCVFSDAFMLMILSVDFMLVSLCFCFKFGTI